MSAPLLTTKLLIPPASGRRVLRPRLIQRLDDCLRHRLTLLSAPAGFGKTALISDWAWQAAERGDHGAPIPVAWVTLDDGDNDPTRFWGYVLTALNRLPALSEAAAHALSTLETAQLPAVEPVLITLINALAERPVPADFVLVLDDFHVITAPSIHDALVFLLDQLPIQMHLVIASRADPPLSLARLRVRGHLLELRAHDLRFTPEEAAAFLNEVMHLQLSPADVVELETRTEGWVAGLQLAALSLQGRDDPAAFIQAFTGQHHFVLEYLVEEVVNRQPEHVRRFLEQTAILERLCGPLCEAVTGQPEGAAMLAQLWRANLFTEPLDEAGQWYHRHHLFTEALLAHLQRSQPDLIPELHRRARDWYAGSGYLHESMRHALAGGQFEWAAETVERELRLVEPLSARELEVLRLMAKGETNQSIADTLVISVGTVKSHINRILGKLSTHNRTEAVACARTLNLL